MANRRSAAFLLIVAALAAVASAAPLSEKLFVEQDPRADLQGQRLALTPDLAAEANRLAGGQWTATADNGGTLRGATLAEARRLMGVRDLDNSDLAPRTWTAAELAADIPESFDSAENWPQCKTIGKIRDQSNCGSCWAIAAADAMSDRYCTVGNLTDVRISTVNLLSCCYACGMGCNGGWPTAAWAWWVWMGLTTEECQPYPFTPCSHHGGSEEFPPCPSEIYPTPACNATCADPKVTLEHRNGATAYRLSSEEAYQRELMTNGPFEVAFTVYEDFLAYKSGVYAHTTGSQLGGHAVRIVGWGVQNGTKYWRLANSWNVGWGDKGYFLIKRGGDECGIEASGVAGLPQV